MDNSIINSSGSMQIPWIPLIILCIILLLLIISVTGVYKKAGYAGWKALIPIYGQFILTKISGLSILYFVLLFVPILNIYAIFKIHIEVAKKFGKSTRFGIGLVLLPFVFYPLLLLTRASYDDGNDEEIEEIVDENSYKVEPEMPVIKNSNVNGVPEIGGTIQNMNQQSTLSIGGMNFKAPDLPSRSNLEDINTSVDIDHSNTSQVETPVIPINENKLVDDNQGTIPEPISDETKVEEGINTINSIPEISLEDGVIKNEETLVNENQEKSSDIPEPISDETKVEEGINTINSIPEISLEDGVIKNEETLVNENQGKSSDIPESISDETKVEEGINTINSIPEISLEESNNRINKNEAIATSNIFEDSVLPVASSVSLNNSVIIDNHNSVVPEINKINEVQPLSVENLSRIESKKVENVQVNNWAKAEVTELRNSTINPVSSQTYYGVKPDLMAPAGTVQNLTPKPDLMAPAGTVQNLTPKPDLMAPANAMSSFTSMSNPNEPINPTELPVQKTIDGKEEIHAPQFNPFAASPSNFISNNQNNSQNPL